MTSIRGEWELSFAAQVTDGMVIDEQMKPKGVLVSHHETDRTHDGLRAPGKTLPSPVRVLLMIAGVASVILGIIGIFLPLVPTVPLLLLAAACFARSSQRLYRLLLDHRRLGPIIRDYADGAGLPVRAKGTAIATIWLTIPPSALFIVPDILVKAMLFVIAIGITIYLVRLPTRQEVEPTGQKQTGQ